MGSELEFWLPANARASVLQKHLETEGATALVALHLTNCRVADPDDLCRLAVRLEKLRTLDCVASFVKARDLLRLMLGPLKHLTHLEFSMVDEDAEAREQVELVGKPTGGEFRATVAENLRVLYVEVANDANFDLLEAFLEYCPNVIDLHVHLVCGTFESAVLRCAQVLANRPLMGRFAFTSEVSPLVRLEPPAALNFGHCATVCANVLYRHQPPEWNCTRLRDLAASTEQALPEPLIVVAVNEPRLDLQIREAALHNNWTNVHLLYLALLSPPAIGNTSHAIASGELCRDALNILFRKFTNLTELNVSSFHFSQGIDLTALLPVTGCPMKALSLAPCGLRHAGALERLARCAVIDDLDIRSGCDGRSKACEFCARGAHLDHSDFEGLSVSGLHGRLTVYKVALLRHLHFVAGGFVAELRIVDNSENPLPDYKKIGSYLYHNLFLRSLLLSYKDLNFTERPFQVDIRKATTLRYLCLPSDLEEKDWSAESALKIVANSFPKLEAMHVHYINEEKVHRKLTWLLPAEEPEVLQGLAEPPPEWAGANKHGHIIRGRPCVLCSTQTFIGLTKAHNRGKKSSV